PSRTSAKSKVLLGAGLPPLGVQFFPFRVVTPSTAPAALWPSWTDRDRWEVSDPVERVELQAIALRADRAAMAAADARWDRWQSERTDPPARASQVSEAELSCMASGLAVG